MRNTIFAVLSLLLFFSACRQDEITITPEITPPDPAITVETGVHGLVRDEQSEPVADAVIGFLNGTSVQTDANGYFSLQGVQSSERALLRVEKDGYFTAWPVYRPHAGATEFLDIQLIERQLSGTLTANTGGTISLPNGSEVDFAPGSFVRPDGSVYNGTVEVYAHYLDPTDPELYQYMPGNLTARNADGEMRGLITYGMLNVELQSPSGEELDIAEAAEISLPVPTELLNDAPAEIPLWYYEEASGLWIEEGSAQLAGNIYTGSVNHFTFWNCDIPFPFVEVSGQVDISGYTPSVEVRLTRLDTGDSASDFTDDKGYFDGKVPMDVVFLLEILDPCGNVMYSEEVGPFTQDTWLGIYEVDTSDDWSVVYGSAVDCDGQSLSNGLVLLQGLSNLEVIPIVNGNFQQLVPTCQNSELTATVIDLTNQLESDPLTFSISAEMDLGILTACGNQVATGILFELGNGETFNVPICFVEVNQDDVPHVFIFNATHDEGNGNMVEHEMMVVDWNGDPVNPFYALANTYELFGTVAENYQVLSFDDVELNFADYQPGGLIQFTANGCLVENISTQEEFPNSTVTITGLVQ